MKIKGRHEARSAETRPTMQVQTFWMLVFYF